MLYMFWTIFGLYAQSSDITPWIQLTANPNPLILQTNTLGAIQKQTRDIYTVPVTLCLQVVPPWENLCCIDLAAKWQWIRVQIELRHLFQWITCLIRPHDIKPCSNSVARSIPLICIYFPWLSNMVYWTHVQMRCAIYSCWNVLKSTKQGSLLLSNSKFPFLKVRDTKSWAPNIYID